VFYHGAFVDGVVLKPSCLGDGGSGGGGISVCSFGVVVLVA